METHQTGNQKSQVSIIGLNEWEDIPPNAEAEQAVIACMLIKPSIVPDVMSKLVSENFYTDICKACFNRCYELYRADKPIDTVSVLSGLPKEYKPVVVKMIESLPTSAVYGFYTKLVIDTHKKKKALESAHRLSEMLLQSDAPLEKCQEQAVNISQSLSEDKSDECVSAKDGLLNFYKQYQEGKRKEYIKTGISKIDEYTYMSRGDFIIIGARPSAGKTALTLQMALNMAKTHKVAYFSLETSAEKLYDRAVSNFANVSFARIKNGLVGENSEKDWQKIAAISKPFTELKLFIVPASGYNVPKIEARAVELGAEVIFIDYLQLVGGKGKDRFEQVTNVSMGLHNLAQQRKIMVVALSQLSRAGSSEPSMKDLRESGQLEADCDCIMLLHNTEPEVESADRTLIIAKNKEGRVGKMTLAFEGDVQRFYERTNF